jgi:hypothetical protein
VQAAVAFGCAAQSATVQQPAVGMQLPAPGPPPGQNFSPTPQVQVLLVQVAVPPQSVIMLQQPVPPLET